MIMLENSELLIVCSGALREAEESLLKWLGVGRHGRGDSNGLLRAAASIPARALRSLWLHVQFTLGESCNMRSQHGN